jgi:hypothetical protein
MNCSFYNNKVGYEIVITYLGNDNYYHTIGNRSGNASCIYNKENACVNINDSTFNNNYAGDSGGAIWSYGNITVNNSQFNDNCAVMDGSSIYVGSDANRNNIINAIISNTNFTNNTIDRHYYESAQAVHIDSTLYLFAPTTALYSNIVVDMKGTISNCNFQDKKQPQYNNVYSSFNTTIENSSFTEPILITSAPNNRFSTTLNNISNNHFYSDINVIDANIYNNTFNNTVVNLTRNINVTENTFTNASTLNINLPLSSGEAVYYQILLIHDNLFLDNDCRESSIMFTGRDMNLFNGYSIYNNTYIHSKLNDSLKLDIPSNIVEGEPVTITGTYALNNPEFYDENILEQNKFEVYINDELTQTVDTLNFTITPTAEDIKLTVQPSISNTKKTTIISTNPISNIIITPENYDDYINEGALMQLNKGTNVTFQGDFTDKGEIYIDTSDIIIDGSNATFLNTIFTLDEENITLQNMKITNTETTSPIANYQDNNIIANNTITLTNTETTTSAIYNKASNTLIENNTITMQAPANDIDFSSGEGVASTQAILLLGGDKNTVRNNTINIKCTQATSYNTLEAITNNNGATNTLITQNKINISDANFNYAIDSINNVENITITENTITVNGERYCDGVQTGNNANNIYVDNNNITCTCINTTEITSEGAITYGVIGTMLGGNGVNNMTITNNNIKLTGTANYGIELYFADTTEIHNNNITVNGPYSMGIGFAYSPNGNATQNTITITGDSTTQINDITEEFKPENVGIRVQNGTKNINIEDNTITTSDIGGNDTTIHTDEENVTIKNNQLTSSQGDGEDTIIAPENTIIENNTGIQKENTLKVDTTEFTAGQPATITASIYYGDDINTTINKGKVTFKVNGKTLKDANGKVIYAKVINGVATIENYEVPNDWTKEGTTIEAIYSGSTQCDKLTSEKTNITVATPEAKLTITPITSDMQTGSTVTLKAKVSAGDKAITTGKVVFKVNGKTVKDANGKVIYAKVDSNGEVSVDYTIPESFKAGTYNIEAVFTASGYEKLTDNTTMTVVKS